MEGSMKNKKELFILMMSLCALDDVAKGSSVQISDSIGDALDDYDDLLDEEDQYDLIGMPEIIAVPPFEAEQPRFVNSEMTIDSREVKNPIFVPDDMGQEDSNFVILGQDIKGVKLKPLSPGIRSEELSMSSLNLNKSGSVNMLSGKNEFSPESPKSIVDIETGLLAATVLKSDILLSANPQSEKLVARINRIQEMLLEHIISVSWFKRELEKIKVDFEQS